MLSIFGVPVDAAYHLVSGFTALLTPVLGGVAAIVAVTMAVRILLMPLSRRAVRGQATAARLAPQVQALRQRYARQPEKLHSELSALYRREGTTMFAGLIPILLQWPFLSVMYLLFRSPLVAGKPNTLLAHDLLGVPLGTHWLSGTGPGSMQGVVFIGVFALLAGLCWLSGRLGPLVAAQAKVLQYLTVVIAAFAPLAAGVYLLTSMGWSLAERRFFLRSSAGESRRDQGAQQPDRW